MLGDLGNREPLTLAQFENWAAAGNPTLAEAEALVKRSAGLAKQAGLYPNPGVGYQAEQIRGGSYSGGEQGGYIEQTFVLGGKLGLRRKVYEQKQRVDEAGASLQRARVMADVRQQFYTALAAQKMVDVRNRLVGFASDAAQTARQLANVGQAETPDVLAAEVEQERAQVDYLNAQRLYLRAFASLAAVAGKPDVTAAPLSGQLEALPQLDAETLLTKIQRESPEVERVQQEIAQAEAAVKSATRERVPDFEVHAGLQNNLEPLGGPGAGSVGMQGFATAGITLPIFNRNQGQVTAAEAEKIRAQQELRRVQTVVRRSAEQAIQDYLAAKWEAAKYKDEMLPRAERAFEAYLTKYQQMASSYSQVLMSQRTLFDLESGYVETLRKGWTSAVALSNYMVDNGLAAPE
jgi:cobalt-zinc-cadmium efflux system outer membrane protein